MRKHKFSDNQVFAVLKQNNNSIAIQDFCREHGIHNASFHK